MELNKNNIIKIVLILAGAIFFAWGLQNLEVLSKFLGFLIGLTAPFLVGLGIAFILNIPMRSLERLMFSRCRRKIWDKLRRPISLVVTILLFLVVILLVMLIVIPEIVRTFATVRDGFPAFLEELRVWAEGIYTQIPDLSAIQSMLPTVDWSNIFQTSYNFLQNGATSVLNSTMGIATSVFSGIMNFVLGLIFAIYILLQREKLARQVKKLLYAFLKRERADRILYIASMSDKTFSNFLTGQCLEAVILGLMFFVSMSIFRFPYAMMISVLIAFMALIPIFGAFIGLVVGALLILVADPIQAFWFVVLFLVLQQIEGNFIYPRVVGSSVGLPAMWVLLAVTLGGSTMGVLGMIINVPLCSVIYALLRETVGQRLKERRITGQELEPKRFKEADPAADKRQPRGKRGTK